MPKKIDTKNSKTIENKSRIKNFEKGQEGKFSGSRLEMARRYNQMTIKDLAEEVGVTKQTISQYENGVIDSPKYEVLLKLISVLGFPKNFFFEDDEKLDIKLGNTYFRASSKMSKKEERMNKVKSNFIGNIYSFISDYLELPVLNLPKLEEDLSIEEKAHILRKYWELGNEPINDIIHILEKNGIVISDIDTESNLVDAFTQKQVINGKEIYIIVLGNDDFSMVRRQFSLAHELGHIILHDGFIEVDDMTNEEIRNIENEAHEFAAAFLLPKEEFRKDVIKYPTNVDYYVSLKRKWKTSISAMIVRASRLKIINYDNYLMLNKEISSRGWRKQEPLDDVLKKTKPIVFRNSVDMLLKYKFTTNEFMNELSKNKISLEWRDVEKLIGLEKDTLKPIKMDEEVIRIGLK